MSRIAPALGVAAFLVLHHDWWNWGVARPLAFGILPVGLWYHAVYTLAAAGVMAALVRWYWPGDEEQDS